jgi:acylphosphatase
MSDLQVALRIEGRVQGVFFRHSARLEAIRLALTGWIRNCADGAVEAVVEGSAEKVREFVAWCRRGPPGARVERVEVEELPANGRFQSFRVEH